MELIIIFGPPAVGKMTVGKELVKITNLKLFHNHMSLELVNNFFEFGTQSFNRLDKVIRFEIFKEVAKSELGGLIFTIVWALNFKEDEEYIDELVEIFEREDWSVKYVELKATLKERLIRNKEAGRLFHKPSKRNIEHSERTLLNFEERYRMNTEQNELDGRNILKIDNTKIEAIEVAKKIKRNFQL